MSARLDYLAGGEAGYTGSYAPADGGFDLGGMLPGDVSDGRQMQAFAPAGMSWWEGVAAYGITRAIDNRFAPVQVQGNTQPGTFAGQNGRTYSNAPAGTTAPGGLPIGLLLAGAALVAVMLLPG